MSAYTNVSHVANESPSKRRRIDSSDSTPTTSQALHLDSDSTYAHRQNLQGRATLSNAAESPYFSKNRALVFQFLDVFNTVQDDIGRLKSCTLRCGICRTGGWRWIKAGKGKGSTSNMNLHMRDKHGLIWQAAIQADKLAWGLSSAQQADSGVPSPAPLSDTPVCPCTLFYYPNLNMCRL